MSLYGLLYAHLWYLDTQCRTLFKRLLLLHNGRHVRRGARKLPGTPTYFTGDKGRQPRSVMTILLRSRKEPS